MYKFVVVLAFVAFASAQHHGFGGHSVSHVSGEDAHAEIKSLDSEVLPDGFHYAYETSNHIKAVASGDEHGNMRGDFEWVSPEGEHIAVKYVADEYGYQPSSDVLPTPPPIPGAILKALEYIRSHPAHEEHHGRF
ncbi:larval cuticle protein 2-like [Lucilia cuprina]|uniref:larval cuticle protein 2-like n=1 Tax=Lucilia cuprina TaxID=7375 RepID=UPI001F0689E1|nr:larval cuticle protein 2-like [Lucilia cuprina]